MDEKLKTFLFNAVWVIGLVLVWGPIIVFLFNPTHWFLIWPLHVFSLIIGGGLIVFYFVAWRKKIFRFKASSVLKA